MIPSDDEQVEMIPERELVDVDLCTEFDVERGLVVLTISAPGEDIVVLLTPFKARAAGDSLFALGCRAP